MFLTPEDAFELATKELQHTTVSSLFAFLLEYLTGKRCLILN
uniref:Uncharacterized protein n=1 Tax=Oryza meridionalis TaxID=40149 RepID=A0A0E0CPN1_9ORYZ